MLEALTWAGGVGCWKRGRPEMAQRVRGYDPKGPEVGERPDRQAYEECDYGSVDPPDDQPEGSREDSS
jgi:hypothetical protein